MDDYTYIYCARYDALLRTRLDIEGYGSAPAAEGDKALGILDRNTDLASQTVDPQGPLIDPAADGLLGDSDPQCELSDGAEFWYTSWRHGSLSAAGPGREGAGRGGTCPQTISSRRRIAGMRTLDVFLCY